MYGIGLVETVIYLATFRSGKIYDAEKKRFYFQAKLSGNFFQAKAETTEPEPSSKPFHGNNRIHTMQKTFPFLVAIAILVFAVGCSPKTTTTVTPGGTDWAAQAANYKKNPDALRQLVEDCEATEKQLMTARQELDQYRSQTGSADAALLAAQNQAAAAQTEIEQLRQQLATLQQAAKDRVDTDLQTVQGVIFQVQLGAFSQNTVDPALSTGDALELENQNGLQKFVVSQFRTYKSAETLKNRLVVMGVKDAFIVAKNNGVRITVPEALKMTGQE